MTGELSILWMTIDRHPDSLKALIRERLASTGWTVHEVSYENIETLEKLNLESINGVLLAPARKIPPKYLRRLTTCSLIQIWSSGYDKFNTEDALESNLPIANNFGANAVAVAEHTIMMLLSISRRTPEMHKRALTGEWDGNDHGMSSHSVAGKTLGLVGLGRIGSLVAVRAQALGMQIMFVDPHVEKTADGSWVKTNFEDLLVEVDYLSFHLHLTEETRSMLNSGHLPLLRKKPYIINVSRAELIEREALISALGGGYIKGLALDAHYVEPTKPDDPLFSFPNILVTPHIAGSTIDSYQTTMEYCVKNLRIAISGSDPEGVIYPQLGKKNT